VRIGEYETTVPLDGLLVDDPRAGRDVVHAFDEDLEVEVRCVLHCDDPEDGVYAEEVEATLLGLPLSEEAVEGLDLAARAAEAFSDGGCAPPKVGSEWLDVDDRGWVVVGTGRRRDRADGDLVMLRGRGAPLDRSCLVADAVEFGFGCWHDDEGRPLWRRVVREDEPPEGSYREAGAVYVGRG